MRRTLLNPMAMPVILTAAEERDVWMGATWGADEGVQRLGLPVFADDLPREGGHRRHLRSALGWRASGLP
jgi:hypothetical protein